MRWKGAWQLLFEQFIMKEYIAGLCEIVRACPNSWASASETLCVAESNTYLS